MTGAAMNGDERGRALIIGGSFAGLAAAIGLRRVGIEAMVFEQADDIRAIDAGVVMQITAMKALRKLGLLGEVRAIGGCSRAEVRSLLHGIGLSERRPESAFSSPGAA